MTHSRRGLLAGLATALVILTAASLLVGVAPLPAGDVGLALLGIGDDRIVIVVQEIRLPRALIGIIAGASFGLAGAALQGLLRNPLAEPGLTGTSASAGLGAVIAFYFGWAASFPLALPLAAMAAAGLATLLLLALTGRNTGTLTLILAGVALSSLATALTAMALNLAPNPFALGEIVLWLMGSLRDRSLIDVGLALPFAAAGWLALATTGRGLDALTLGEDTAHSLGIAVDQLRLRVIAGTAMAVGAAVAAVGAVGFVGLVVPHLLRPLAGYRPSSLLLPSALGGAALVTAADIAVRLIPTASELMLGVLTSLVGAPFFLFLVLRTRWSET